MKVFDWLQAKVLGRSDVFISNMLYMRRWRLGPDWLPGLRVHHIALSDQDRELHDHPFDFVSFIVSGGYIEHTPQGRFVRKPGDFVVRRAEDTHRIELRKQALRYEDGKCVEKIEVPAWTIVLRGPYRRDWGFITRPGVWIMWKDFMRLKNQAPKSASVFTAPSSN